MAEPVTAIRNVGPRMAEAFARAGIHTADALRRLGPDTAYHRLIATGHPPHFIGYYALVMGLQGRPWNDCRGQEKAQLRARFDALKAEGADLTRSSLEAELDRIGVVPRHSKPS